MKALTIRQPWAQLIALGVKRYETRSRPTNVRGRIAIHAGRAMPRGTDLATAWNWIDLDRSFSLLRLRADTHWTPMPRGFVIATAELVDCIPTYARGVPPLEHDLGDWTPGRWAWQLDDVQILAEPVPAKGRQGWWEWSES